MLTFVQVLEMLETVFLVQNNMTTYITVCGYRNCFFKADNLFGRYKQ